MEVATPMKIIKVGAWLHLNFDVFVVVIVQNTQYILELVLAFSDQESAVRINAEIQFSLLTFQFSKVPWILFNGQVCNSIKENDYLTEIDQVFKVPIQNHKSVGY